MNAGNNNNKKNIIEHHASEPESEPWEHITQ
jgi:hypothetical protein